jgi:hypothetical protein
MAESFYEGGVMNSYLDLGTPLYTNVDSYISEPWFC